MQCTSSGHFRWKFIGTPEDHGWILQDGQYKIKWFSGEQLPPSIIANERSFSTMTENDDLDIENGQYDTDSDDDD